VKGATPERISCHPRSSATTPLLCAQTLRLPFSLVFQELVDECSANITGPAFCDSCVRPIARLEISNYYEHMMNDSIPENLTQPQQHAVFDRAGEQIMERLESYGVPMDGFFYANVIFCSLYDGDSACRMNGEC
jgi:hypothetical protein